MRICMQAPFERVMVADGRDAFKPDGRERPRARTGRARRGEGHARGQVVGSRAGVLESRVRSSTSAHTRERPMDALDRYLEDHKPQFLENLKACLRIPSVSAQ